jgi:hypothetical protein
MMLQAGNRRRKQKLKENGRDNKLNSKTLVHQIQHGPTHQICSEMPTKSAQLLLKLIPRREQKRSLEGPSILSASLFLQVFYLLT